MFPKQISGGTGVSPFVQLLQHLSPTASEKPSPVLPTFTLLHTSSSLPLSALTGYLPDPYLLPAKLELADLVPSRNSAGSSTSKVLLPPVIATSASNSVKSLFVSPAKEDTQVRAGRRSLPVDEGCGDEGDTRWARKEVERQV